MQVEKKEAGRERKRQAEAGRGNVPSLYVLFISYQFAKVVLCTLNWICVHFYSQLDLCTLVQSTGFVYTCIVN